MIQINRAVNTSVGSDKFINTTLFVYSDIVEHYEVVDSNSTITTTNTAAINFANRFFAGSSNQRLILKSATSSYSEAIELVDDQFLYCCSDAKHLQLEMLLEWCAGKPFIFIFFSPQPSRIVIPSADNLVAVVTGYEEVNHLSTLYPLVSLVDFASSLSGVFDTTLKTLAGFNTESMSSNIVVNDVTSAFNAPNTLALNRIIFINSQQMVRYDTLNLRVTTLSGLLSELQQLESDLLAAPEGDKAAIQDQINLLKVDINILIADIVNLINEIQQANAEVNELLLIITSTLPDDVSASITNLLIDTQNLVDSLVIIIQDIETTMVNLESSLNANTPASDLIPIIANLPNQINSSGAISQNIVTNVDSVLTQVAPTSNNQLESLLSTLVVSDVIVTQVLLSVTADVEMIQSNLIVQDVVRDQVLLFNTMEDTLLQSSITVQDVVRA